MSDLKDFNWTGFWNDVDYAFESYIGKPVTDDDIKDAESELGYTLPVAYIELLKKHNGGVVKKNCFINDDDDCVYVTGIYGIDNLSPILLSTLGRMYNNNGRPAEAIDLFNRIDEAHRDWSWYYRCGYAHASLGCGESYESEHVQQALQLIEVGMKMAKESHLDKQLGWCCEVVKYLLTQIKPKDYKEDYPVIFDTIKNLFDKKNSKITTEGKDIEDVNEYEEDNYPTYDAVHWVFNKQTYSREEFSKEYNKIVEKYVDDDQADDDDRLEEPEILVTYEAWIESEDQLFDNERVTDEELLEEDKEDGMWQVEIMAHLVADNGTYFTREELLFKLHNLMANKELGDHVFFEGIEYEGHECEGYGLIDNEDGIPVFFIVCGS